MKLKLILALLVGLVSTVSATESRLNGMGNPGILVRDNSEIFTFPSAIMNYSKEITAEMRQPNDVSSYTLGGNIPIGESIFGIYLNNKLRGFGERMGTYNDINNVELNNTIGFLYGMNISTMDLGFSLDFAFDKNNSSSKSGDNSIESDASVTYVKVGGGASAQNFDASLVLDVPMISSDTKDNSMFGATATGRYFIDTKVGTLVPAVILGYGMSTLKSTVGETTNTTEITDLVFDLSLGYNLNITEASMLFAGVEALGISMTSVDDYSYTNTVAPKFYLGVESQVKEWFAARFGGSKKYAISSNSYDGENVESDASSSSAPFDINIGASFGFGSFELDANVDEALLFNGPNFITGATSAFAADLALTYSFGNPKDLSTQEVAYVPETQSKSITIIERSVVSEPKPETVESSLETENSDSESSIIK